jgi:hypothetical protein
MFGSDFNPWLRALAPVAASILRDRSTIPDTSRFKVREIETFDAVRHLIAKGREVRDQGYEFWFETLYGRKLAADVGAPDSEPQPASQSAYGRAT